MHVYFAHPYDTVGTADEKRLLEEMVKRGWDVLNPFENNPDDDVIERIKRGNFNAHDAQVLVKNDLCNLVSCGAVLVWIPDNVRTVGTTCEMIYAFEARKYIIVIHQRDGVVHPWIVYHAGVLYKTVEAFIADVPMEI